MPLFIVFPKGSFPQPVEIHLHDRSSNAPMQPVKLAAINAAELLGMKDQLEV